jgi:cytidylate kinase
MPVITIRGQLGSGAPEIANRVAERLHIDYVDREIIADLNLPSEK